MLLSKLKRLLLGRGRKPGLALPLLMLALVLGLKFSSDFYFWLTLGY